MEAGSLNITNKNRTLEGLEDGFGGLSLDYCGIEKTAPGHRFGPNMRNSYLFHVVLGGKGTLDIDNVKYNLHSGDVFYIPKQKRAFYQADLSDPWVYMWVGVNGFMVTEVVQRAGFSSKIFVQTVTPEGLTYLEEAINNMLELYPMSFVNTLKRNAYLLNFFAVLTEEYEKKHQDKENLDTSAYAYISQAMDYMKYHFSENISISEVSVHIGINRSYLSFKFKQITGVTPRQYLMDLRINNAKVLLKQSKDSIKNIANRVGYKDSLTFSRAFRQAVGISPKQYRNS